MLTMDQLNTKIGQMLNLVLAGSITSEIAQDLIRSWQDLEVVTIESNVLIYNSKLGIKDYNRLLEIGKELKEQGAQFSFHGVSIVIAIDASDKASLLNLLRFGFYELKESNHDVIRLQYNLVKKWFKNSYTLNQKRRFFPN